MVVAKKQMYVEQQPEYNHQTPTPKKTEKRVTISVTQTLHQRVVPTLLVLIVFVLASMLIIRYTKISNMQIEINQLNQEVNKEAILTNQLELELSRCYDVAYAERSLIVQQNIDHIGQKVVYVDLNNTETMETPRQSELRD